MSAYEAVPLFGPVDLPPGKPAGRMIRPKRRTSRQGVCQFCGEPFTRSRDRRRYCSALCRERAIAQRQFEARRLAQVPSPCRLSTCPSLVAGRRRRYCSEECRLTAAARPDLIRGSTLVAIRCAWCHQPAPNQVAARRSPRRIWPYLCDQCWRPLLRVRKQLRAHRVPAEHLHRLAQRPLCDICGVDVLAPAGPNEVRAAGMPGEGRARPLLAIDHDHRHCPGPYSCGRCFRGFLCLRCNLMLGHAAEDPARLRAAIGYLTRHPEEATVDHIIAIPAEVQDDKTINLWEWVRPQIAARVEAALTG
jgi:hypothetical protein